ncbi:homoserine dehydrogenase [Luteimonas sp. FCS-9]|uniref:homoserine dehydrogenase n=1 Tax=Luteimonas sp. FCS-9 TaxID=1547516 RepID=UPI00063EA011|nr:homoserine dehydrogenase [Luteimonas sp. FCS-9]KLI98867.1 homoserine dehydrogenase [Luteimonas sp. FCS-9]
MSAVVALRRARRPQPQPTRLALLGTGTVGSAFVGRYQRLAAQGVALPAVSWICNSRTQIACDGDPAAVLDQVRAAAIRRAGFPPWAEGESPRPGDIVVDATASETVADWHPEWLARGIHVVTANKLGTGGELGRAQAIAEAGGAEGGGRYGDSATVGAGLPLLRSLRALVAGGDRIHAVEGVLSGSLAWLFSHYDGSRPFSALVREARAAGFTEPDPRVDLSGEDVRRKLLILARAAGLPLSAHQVAVESLVPAALAGCGAEEVDTGLGGLDAALAARWAAASAEGLRLRFVGRFDALGGASVGLRALPAHHPLCAGGDTDNRVAIHSDRYLEQPLVVQGPGAGAEVTAAALLDDVLGCVQR